MFKVGDRVVSNGYIFGKLKDGCKGTVKRASSYGCAVYFDDVVDGWSSEALGIPDGHGLYIKPENLTLIESEGEGKLKACKLMVDAMENPQKYEGKRYKVDGYAEWCIRSHAPKFYTTIMVSKKGRLVGVNDDGSESSDCVSVCNFTELDEIPQPVPFMEAVKAYSEGKEIYCIDVTWNNQKHTYEPEANCNGGTVLTDENGNAPCPDEILHGEWHVKGN